VWNHARTEAQVRANLTIKLTGKESDLVALYNFADAAQPGRDATGRGQDGKLQGNAKIVLAKLPLPGAVTTPERVLELDGTNSFVELPPNIFIDLDEATVEAWVRWDKPTYMRFFVSGELDHDLGVGGRGDGELHFFIRDKAGGNYSITVPGLALVDAWSHVAAVSGKGGMRLYLNGALVATNAFTGSFAGTGGSAPNWIGRWHGGESTFAGQIDDLRVWRVARTETDIRGDMLKTLNGNEPGLVGYWNFNDGTANDVSAGRHHGTLQGKARIVAGRRTGAQEFIVPVLITGKITDAAGHPLRNADVILRQNGQDVLKARSSLAGEYRIYHRKPNDQAYDLRVTRENLGNGTNGIILAAGGSKNLDFALFEAPSVFGSVLSAEKRSRAGGKVQLEAMAKEEGRMQNAEKGRDGGVVATTLSNVRGEYRFKNVAPGQYRVRAASATGQVYFAEGKVVTLAERTPPNQADIQLPAPSSTSALLSTNQVLQFGGGESYVELPSNIFNDLEEATVE